jgi:Flp pilus assembly CpaF family ATPase
MSFDVILPFLRPIALITDPDVSEIMVNGASRIFVEQQGLVREVSAAMNETSASL